jgi:two-component system, chemotaxis family, protein-glutamate methylesterase/glutaminase
VAERLVVIGASAGGVEALMKVAGALPRDFAAPVVIVLHIGAEGPSVLPQILARSGPLPVQEACDGELLQPGTIYTAIPDHHVLVDEDKTLRLVKGPRENRHRPAIDPLFRSAALAFRSRCIGVILTGTLDDGTAGMLAVKKGGGVAIVQDPADATYPSMPQSVLDFVKVDYVLPLAGIAAKLVECVQTPCATTERTANLEMLKMEKKIVALDPKTLQVDDRPGTPSAYSCPDCGGVLWEIEDGDDYVRYRCRVGHAFSPETMLDAQSNVLEEALWTAMKTLEESARLSARLAENERKRGHEWLVKRFETRERDARQRAELIRRFLTTEEAREA